MPNFSDAVAQAARDATCGLLAANDNIQGWWARNTNLPFTDGLANAASGLRRSLCDDPSPVPSRPPGFVGGQCPGTTYTVTAVWTQGDGTPRSATRFGQGPVSGIVFGQDGFGRDRAFIQFADSRVVVGGSDFCEPGETNTCVVAGSVAITSVAPDPGEPDDCGDPGFQPAPPFDLDLTVPVSITYNDNSNNPVTELGDFNLALPIFLPGSIQIPFDIDFGGFTFNGSLDFEGNLNINLGGRGGGDTVTEPGLPELPPGNDPGDSETERRVIGVVVVSTVVNSNELSIISQDNNPDVYIPDLGLVSFLVPTGSSSAWTADIRIKNLRQYVAVEARQGAINVQATPRPGVEFQLFRVYGDVPDLNLAG